MVDLSKQCVCLNINCITGNKLTLKRAFNQNMTCVEISCLLLNYNKFNQTLTTLLDNWLVIVIANTGENFICEGNFVPMYNL